MTSETMDNRGAVERNSAADLIIYLFKGMVLFYLSALVGLALVG